MVAVGALGEVLNGIDEDGGQRIGGGRKNQVSAIELVTDGLLRREKVALDDEAVIVGTTHGTGRDKTERLIVGERTNVSLQVQMKTKQCQKQCERMTLTGSAS